MAALDTNVLVRWLTDDDANQSAVVASLLEVAEKEEVRLFVPVTVILETEWVLRSRYRFDAYSGYRDHPFRSIVTSCAASRVALRRLYCGSRA